MERMDSAPAARDSAGLGALSQPLFTLARRRGIMRSALHESINAYKAVTGNPVAWDISDLIGATQRSRGRLQGADAVLSSINEARSTTDLNEDNDRVLDLVARIQRWLRAEPAARRLQMVQAQDPPTGARPDRANLPWGASNTSLDTYMLLEAAKNEPPDAAWADDLVARLLRQAVWHHSLRYAWTHGDDSLSASDLKDLDGQSQTASVPGVMSRTAAEQELLSAELDKRMRSISLDAGPMPLPPNPAPPLVEPTWTSSPDLFIGWATLDGPSFGQLVSQSRATGRALRSPSKPKDQPTFERSAWSWASGFIVVLVIIAAASLAYLPTAYSDTWGNTTDILTAITAGLAGHIVINWTALPLFQSRRLRLSTAAAASAAAPPQPPPPAPTS